MLRHPKVKAEKVGGSSRRMLPADVFRETKAFGDLVGKTKHTFITGSPIGDQVPLDLGFVRAAIVAYNQHHGLMLRPDDVWQAVVTQLSIYIQKNAEKLRTKFVSHDGKKELVVRSGGTLRTAPWTEIGQMFVDAIQADIKDPSIAKWLTPDFSTTTVTDRMAASISVMATLQAYYDFKCELMCGLPSVDLLGTVEDWRKLLDKIERIAEFDAGDGHLTEWTKMLRPVIAEMVATKEGKDNMDWWQRIANYEGGGSGPTYLSGWITVFACFNHVGAWQGAAKEKKLWCRHEPIVSDWPLIDTDDIPNAVLVVPMLIDDNGEALYHAVLAAGQVETDTLDDNTKLAPRIDWGLYVPTEELVQ